PDALQLECQSQRHAQVRRVGDADEEPRDIFGGEPSQHDVPGYDLVEAAGAQRISPGKIDQPDRQAGRRYHHALLAFDSDPGIIRDLLAAAGQRVEEGGFAAVGIADKSNARGQRQLAHPRSGATRIEAASRRRSATVASFTRTAIGSRPNKPSCSVWTRAPSTKPSSISRLSSSAADSPSFSATTRIV